MRYIRASGLWSFVPHFCFLYRHKYRDAALLQSRSYRVNKTKGYLTLGYQGGGGWWQAAHVKAVLIGRDLHRGARVHIRGFQLLVFCFLRTVRHRIFFFSPYEILDSLALIGNWLKHCAGQTKYICRLNSIFWLSL